MNPSSGASISAEFLVKGVVVERLSCSSEDRCCLTFDMSGSRRQAKPAEGCPLDGGVKRHASGRANSLAAWRRARWQGRRLHCCAPGRPPRTGTSLGKPASAVLVGRTDVGKRASNLDGGLDLTGEPLSQPFRVLLVVRCLGLKLELSFRVEASRPHLRLCRTREKTCPAGERVTVPASTSAIRL